MKQEKSLTLNKFLGLEGNEVINKVINDIYKITSNNDNLRSTYLQLKKYGKEVIQPLFNNISTIKSSVYSYNKSTYNMWIATEETISLIYSAHLESLINKNKVSNN